MRSATSSCAGCSRNSTMRRSCSISDTELPNEISTTPGPIRKHSAPIAKLQPGDRFDIVSAHFECWQLLRDNQNEKPGTQWQELHAFRHLDDIEPHGLWGDAACGPARVGATP